MDGMAMFGAIVGGLALLGIILAYTWGEAKTPGWGWKRQVENPTATTEEQLDQPARKASGGTAPVGTPTSAGASSATPEEELDQAVQAATRQHERSFR